MSKNPAIRNFKDFQTSDEVEYASVYCEEPSFNGLYS